MVSSRAQVLNVINLPVQVLDGLDTTSLCTFSPCFISLLHPYDREGGQLVKHVRIEEKPAAELRKPGGYPGFMFRSEIT